MAAETPEEQGALLSEARLQCSETGSKAHQSAEDLDTLEANGSASPSPVPTKTFALLVGAYVAPLVYALGCEGVYASTPRRSLPSALTATPSVSSLGLWLALNVALYILQRRLGRAWRWKMHDKATYAHKEDLFKMGYLSGIFCVAGRVGARLDRHPLAFPALLVAYTLAFGLLFEMVRHCNIQFTRDCVNNSYSIGFAAFLSLILAALAVNHISLLVALHSDLPSTLALVAVVFGSHVALSASPGPSCAHWHHWYTGALGALCCPFDSLASGLAQAMLLGIYLHGAALFGIEPCFYPEDS